ncbi:MAG TPA: hypothetical protein VGF99_04555 [Myxococcota bacterium]
MRPRRPGFVVVAVLLLLTTVFADAALARKKKSKAPPAPAEPLDIAVLPFDALRGRDARAAREALELELELLEGVRVQDSGALGAELDKAKDPLAAATIKAAMARRSVEVLVATPPGYERPIVVGYGADGRPRVIKELPRGASADQLAATALLALKPAFDGWRELPPLALPGKNNASRSPEGSTVVVADDDDDVLVPETGGRTKKPTRSLDDDDDVLVDDPPPKPKKPAKTPSIDDATGDDDDAERQRRRALDDSEEENLDGGRRRTIDEIDEDRDNRAVVKSTHTFLIAGAFNSAAWSYTFDGDNNLEPDPVDAGLYPGARLHLDLWPTEWLGFDASASLSFLRFQINSSPTITVSPSRFDSQQIIAGGAAKVRWVARFADDGPLRLIGLGGRLGYRYWQGTAETQRVQGSQSILTVVPGFTLHSLSLGPELYLPIFVLDRRFEFELKADTLPLTRYAESPDNPGKNSLAFGYHAEAELRLELLSGVFLELGGTSTGLTVNFEGQGDRVTVQGASDLVPLLGGRALNATIGFNVGLGFML